MSPKIPIAMSVEIDDHVKLRPSVAVVVKAPCVEFFRTNIRESLLVRMSPTVAQWLFELDGTFPLREWFRRKQLTAAQQQEFLPLLNRLNREHILLKMDEPYGESYVRFPRVFTLLEEYYTSTAEVNRAFSEVESARVMVIGLGAVGSWVAQSLLMSGVRNFVLVDADRVEQSNLHRQCGYRQADIGQKKIEVFQRHLRRMVPQVEITPIDDWLTPDFFERYSPGVLDLIINCADSPTVDATSAIVAEYAMAQGIPHIIGGGYNLHQSLIGQVVLPGQSACYECFRMGLDQLNEIDTTNITKLEKPTRKVGSFPPLSALSASITANEAFKVLAARAALAMTDRRTEFYLKEMNFGTIPMHRQPNCKWCGTHGRYYQL